MTTTALTEAEKMQRVSGIVFADGPCGRRARLSNTGLDVFEVIMIFRQLGGDQDALHENFHWLTAEQLQAALNYYAAFPDEIDARLALESALSPEP